MYVLVLADQALAALREFLLALGCIGTATSAQEIVFFWGLLSNWLLLEKDLDFIGLSLYEVVHICQGAVALFDKVCLEGGLPSQPLKSNKCLVVNLRTF